MSKIKAVFYIALIFLILFACTSQEEKVKKELTKAIDKELKFLQEIAIDVRDNPKCTQVGLYDSDDIEFFAEWYTIITRYEYTIEKTDSAVAPYTATAYTADVKFKGIQYEKRGKTLQDCSNSGWSTTERELLFSRQEYAYQNGKWLLKAKNPSTYRLYRTD